MYIRPGFKRKDFIELIMNDRNMCYEQAVAYTNLRFRMDPKGNPKKLDAGDDIALWNLLLDLKLSSNQCPGRQSHHW